MVYKWAAYQHRNGTEVEVVDVSKGRVQFKEITRWNFGYPSTSGITQSTGIERFESEYTMIDVPQV